MMDIHLEHNHSRMSEKLLDTFYKVEVKHWWWKARRDIIESLILHRLHKKENLILDAGCGTGSNMMFLNRFGKVYGVDISPVATKFCRKRGLRNVKTSDISNLPFNNNSFHIVSCMDVLEHIEDEKKAINEIYRVLKPGGTIILTVPALPFIFSDHDKAQGHFRRYNKRNVKDLLSAAGFEENRITYFNALLSFPIIIIRLFSKIKSFSKAAHFDARYNFEIYQNNLLNELLYRIFSQEANILKMVNIPFGVSIIALYTKPKRKN